SMEETSWQQLDDYVAMDRTLHLTICSAAGNPFLRQLWEVTYDTFLDLRRKIGLTPEDLQLSNERHRKLVEALTKRDPEAVRHEIIESLSLGERDLVEAVEQIDSSGRNN